MKKARRWLMACVLVTDPMALEPHDFVLLGKVKSSFGDEVTIEPQRYFKGEPYKRIVVYSSPSDDADCNPTLEAGASYLLYGSRSTTLPRPYVVISLALPEDQAQSSLAALGDGEKPRLSGSNLSPKRIETTRDQRASAGLVVGVAIGVVFAVFAVFVAIYYLIMRIWRR